MTAWSRRTTWRRRLGVLTVEWFARPTPDARLALVAMVHLRVAP